jgi:hypothetical protein
MINFYPHPHQYLDAAADSNLIAEAYGEPIRFYWRQGADGLYWIWRVTLNPDGSVLSEDRTNANSSVYYCPYSATNPPERERKPVVWDKYGF